MNRSAMLVSKSDSWETPQLLFDRLDAVFNFDTDVCATEENTKCNHFYTKEEDGLSQPWHGVCWMNPPYGRQISKWLDKAYVSAKDNGATVVCLVPARTETKWWHDYCVKGEVYFIKGRLRFGGSTENAPFPNAIVTFRPTVEDAFK